MHAHEFTKMLSLPMCHGPGSNLPNMSLQKIGMPVIRISRAREDVYTPIRPTVAPVQSDSAHVEDAKDSRIRSKTDEVDRDAEKYGDPGSQNRGASQRQDLRPDVRKWYEPITGKSEGGSTKCLHRSESDKFDDGERAYREDHAASLAQEIEEDLSNRPYDPRSQDRIHVAHAEAENDREQPANNVREQHSQTDRPRRFKFWFANFFRNVSGCLDSRSAHALCLHQKNSHHNPSWSN